MAKITSDEYFSKFNYPNYNNYGNMEDYIKADKEYRKHKHDKIEEFRNDLEKEFCVIGNPKCEKLFEIAWNLGHSSGYYEVYNYYSEFVELIR